MKTTLAWILMLWFALVIEHARADLVLSHCVFLPLAVGCLFWLRSATGNLLVGTVMIIGWLLRPVTAPIDLTVVLIIATWFIARSTRQTTWSPTSINRSRHSVWLHPFCVLVVGLACHVLMIFGFNIYIAVMEFLSRLFVAAPILGLLLIVIRVADEFGWRKYSTV